VQVVEEMLQNDRYLDAITLTQAIQYCTVMLLKPSLTVAIYREPLRGPDRYSDRRRLPRCC